MGEARDQFNGMDRYKSGLMIKEITYINYSSNYKEVFVKYIITL